MNTEMLQLRISEDCTVQIEFNGLVTQEAISKLVAVLNIQASAYPSKKQLGQPTDYIENNMGSLAAGNNKARAQNWGPTSYLKPQFKTMTQEKALLTILKSLGRPLKIDEAVELLYDTSSEEEFNRAKDSVGVALRIAVKKGKCQKIGRGLFAFNDFTETT